MSENNGGSKCAPVTKEEQKWIEEFKKVCAKCPRKLWLFSASGTLHIMKIPDDGNTKLKNLGVNPDNIVGWAEIKNDGGDW